MRSEFGGASSTASLTAALSDCLEALGLPPGAARLRLHSPAGRAAAWCEPGVIHLRPPGSGQARWRSSGGARQIIAHEAVHVAQFAASLSPGSPLLLECEAELLGPRLAAGHACRVSLGAAPGRLNWNRVGHYYTLYAVGLVAGGLERDAQRMAFYGQVPDLVSEFDAVTQAEIRLNILDMWGAAYARHSLAAAKPGVKPTDPEICLDVIEGLHCLTGGPVSAERSRRTGFLTQSSWGSLSFGIALHAFGDAWAHCKGGSMYGHDYGHAFDRHDPDNIHLHKPEYLDYVKTLHGIFKQKIAKSKHHSSVRRPDINELISKLGEIADQPDNEYENNQISKIRALIRSMSTQQALVAYQPDYDCKPWSEFIADGDGWDLKPSDFQKIMDLGKAWRLTPRPSTPAASPAQKSPMPRPNGARTPALHHRV